MQKKQYKSVPVDKRKLMACLDSTNKSGAEVAREFGFSDDYFNKCCSQGRMGAPAAKLLESVYGFPPSLYAPKDENAIEEPKADKAPMPDESREEFWQKMREVIRDAVKEALEG